MASLIGDLGRLYKVVLVDGWIFNAAYGTTDPPDFDPIDLADVTKPKMYRGRVLCWLVPKSTKVGEK